MKKELTFQFVKFFFERNSIYEEYLVTSLWIKELITPFRSKDLPIRNTTVREILWTLRDTKVHMGTETLGWNGGTIKKKFKILRWFYLDPNTIQTVNSVWKFLLSWNNYYKFNKVVKTIVSFVYLIYIELYLSLKNSLFFVRLVRTISRGFLVMYGHPFPPLLSGMYCWLNQKCWKLIDTETLE